MAVLLQSQAELDERVAGGEIEIFTGTPDTGGKGFVVNCTSPIVAPNDVEATDLMPIARSMTWRYEESAHVG